jgi:hypothetical protein
MRFFRGQWYADGGTAVPGSGALTEPAGASQSPTSGMLEQIVGALARHLPLQQMSEEIGRMLAQFGGALARIETTQNELTLQVTTLRSTVERLERDLRGSESPRDQPRG